MGMVGRKRTVAQNNVEQINGFYTICNFQSIIILFSFYVYASVENSLDFEGLYVFSVELFIIMAEKY